MADLQAQLKYQVEKAGFIYDEADGYVVTTPLQASRHADAGKVKVASFSPYEGERLVIFAAQQPKKRGLVDRMKG